MTRRTDRLPSFLPVALVAAFAALVLPAWAPSGTTVAEQAIVKVSGVPHPLALAREDLAKMPRQRVKASAHGETGGYEGVAMREILTRAGVPAGDALRGADLAKAVVVAGADGYRVAFSLAEFDPGFTDRASILADTKDGQPLAGNAAPYQLILADEKRPARWVRQVVTIEVVGVGSPGPRLH
jgi:DMSO/TMAO reductase YedYZ molybdopterin-dependent catalytic subunit